MATSTFCRSRGMNASLFRTIRASPAQCLALPHASPFVNMIKPHGALLRANRTPLERASCFQQRRAASFLRDSSITSSQRTTRDSNRTSTPRSGERNEKISTLAMDHTSEIPLVTEEPNAQQQHRNNNSSDSRQGYSSPVRSRRRLLLISTVILLPFIGRDVLETVLPGFLGVLIFTLGNLKAAWKWLTC